MINLWGEIEATPSMPIKPPVLEGFCCPTCGLSNLGKDDMRKDVVGEGRRRRLEDVCRRCGTTIRYVEEQWRREWRLREQRIERLLKKIREQALVARNQLPSDEVESLIARLDAILADEPDEVKACEQMLSELRKVKKCSNLSKN